MRTSLLISLRSLGLLALLSAGTASAQTLAGSDDFNDGTLSVGAGQRWLSASTSNGSSFTESGGVLNYTNGAETTGFIRWITPSTNDRTFANDFTATILVNNDTNPASGYVTAGFEIYTAFESGGSLYYNGYYAIMTIDNPSGGGIVTEWYEYDSGLDDYLVHSNYIATGDTTDITLQLAWDAASSTLTASYSSNGTNFTTGQTFALAGAEATELSAYGNTFGLELFGRSAEGAGAITGGVSFDNMSVSAVPEPSTYAAIAGALMLGFAAWKRRRTPGV